MDKHEIINRRFFTGEHDLIEGWGYVVRCDPNWHVYPPDNITEDRRKVTCRKCKRMKTDSPSQSGGSDTNK